MHDEGQLILSYEFNIRVGEQTGKAGMSYFQGDPYAVFLFIASTKGIVKWVFGRELLRGGGHGQVIVAHHRDMVIITLRGPNGTAPVIFEKKYIDAFIEDIYRLVPEGEESNFLDIEGEYKELLAVEESED